VTDKMWHETNEGDLAKNDNHVSNGLIANLVVAAEQSKR
jgi:hypothetical protein